MGSLITKQKQEEKTKRYLFLGTEILGAVITLSLPVVGIPVMAFGAYLGWRWLQFRMKNGMRF